LPFGPTAATLVALTAVGAGAASDRDRDDRRSGGDEILEFDVMIGNDEPFIGAKTPIRGINAGGAPWKLDSAKGELRTNGRLGIKVEGLVVAPTGENPVPAFRGVVNCLTPEAPINGVNLVTDPAPATRPGGDARIRDYVNLPEDCIAPIVFVTHGAIAEPGVWFAATGAGAGRGEGRRRRLSRAWGGTPGATPHFSRLPYEQPISNVVRQSFTIAG
jgi:hypothetical protein